MRCTDTGNLGSYIFPKKSSSTWPSLSSLILCNNIEMDLSASSKSSSLYFPILWNSNSDNNCDLRWWLPRRDGRDDLYGSSGGAQRISEANDNVYASNEATERSNLVCSTDIPSNIKLATSCTKNTLALLGPEIRILERHTTTSCIFNSLNFRYIWNIVKHSLHHQNINKILTETSKFWTKPKIHSKIWNN